MAVRIVLERRSQSLGVQLLPGSRLRLLRALRCEQVATSHQPQDNDENEDHREHRGHVIARVVQSTVTVKL